MSQRGTGLKPFDCANLAIVADVLGTKVRLFLEQDKNTKGLAKNAQKIQLRVRRGYSSHLQSSGVSSLHLKVMLLEGGKLLSCRHEPLLLLGEMMELLLLLVMMMTWTVVISERRHP